MNKTILNDKWIKASVTGTIWAASEIVFGSFLHNLKIPFCGNILTAIGLIILISTAFLWKERGIFWRAGLICALMKTMSPSAVIFGPMIAIFTEALILEIAIFILGRTYAGFIIASILAMSWNLIQKILSYILFYGFDIIEIYKGLVKIAEKQISYNFDLLWLPVLILLASYALFGAFAGVMGIRVGRKVANGSVSESLLKSRPYEKKRNQNEDFKHSLFWLFSNIIFIISGLILFSKTNWYIWTPAIVLIATLWIVRYRRALKKISNPKFWLFFVLITLVTVFVFTRIKSGEDVLINGLITGLQMNLRAVLMVLGFSVLAVELYNPIVRDFFRRSSFRQLPAALELSTESLPLIISSIPDFKTAVRKPISIFTNVVLLSDIRLREIKGETENQTKVFIVSGAKNEGKTSFIKSFIELVDTKHFKLGGVISEKYFEEGEVKGYDILSIKSKERVPFLREGDFDGCKKIRKFSIFDSGIEFGNSEITEAINLSDLIIIDEIGQLELADTGWFSSLSTGLKATSKLFVLVVRDEFVDDIIEKFDLKYSKIIKISKSTPANLYNEFLK